MFAAVVSEHDPETEEEGPEAAQQEHGTLRVTLSAATTISGCPLNS